MHIITKKTGEHIIDYTPAEYRNNKDSYVQFYAIDPNTGNLRRKRIRLNRIKSSDTRKKYALDLCKRLNRKLEKGWSPFVDVEAPRASTKLFDACDAFIYTKKKDGRRPDTMRCLDIWFLMLCRSLDLRIGNYWNGVSWRYSFFVFFAGI